MKNKITLIQFGYSTPVAFASRTKALSYLKKKGYLYKEKKSPYFWQSKDEAENMSMQDSEFRAWLMEVSVQ